MSVSCPESVIGVDIGGTSTRIMQVHEEGMYEDTFAKYSTPEDAGEFWHTLGTKLVKLAKERDVNTVAMGLPGPVQWDGETPVSAGPFPNITAFTGEEEPFDVRARLVEEVAATDSLNIVYFNDAHIAAQAAVRLLVPDGYKNERPHGTILVSTGIGGEFLVDYRPIFRNRNILGEYGHVGLGNPAVSIEDLVSGTAIANRYGRTTTELTGATDPAAESIWREMGETLAAGFGYSMAVFGPDRLAFAGSVSAYGHQRFMPYFDARMQDMAWAGRAVNAKAPEIDVVSTEMVDMLALRGTIWAYQGLRPTPAL